MLRPFMRSRVGLLLLVVAASGCRCGGGLEQVTAGFTAAPGALDFGRVLEGTKVTRVVTLAAEARVTVTVSAATSAPFSSAATVVIPGGSQLDLPVVFTAGNEEATGTLVLSANQKSVTITLHGVGVRPLTCTPSGPCMKSTYSLDEGRCVETAAPEGLACDTGELCLELGRCTAGRCLGVARRCDDNDACTVDGCSNTTGCVHSPVTCPAPSNRCERATCDPTSGCGATSAGDGQPCGPATCASTSLCVAGQCKAVQTPDDTPCGVELACLPIGRCHHQECTRPDAGDWHPMWSAELQGVPVGGQAPVLLATATSVFFPLCGVPVFVDPDAGLDGGEVDGGDGGMCALLSWTTSGFDRYRTRLGEARALVNVSPRGVLLLGDGGLELYALGNGALVDTAAVAAQLDTVGYAPNGALLFVRDDGEVQSWTNGAVTTVGQLGEGGALAIDRAGGVFSWSGGGLLNHLSFAGGATRLGAVAMDPDERSLTAVGYRAVVGLHTAVTMAPAGVVVMPLQQDDFVQSLEPRGVLQTGTEVAFFTRRCPVPLVTCADTERTAWVSLNELTGGSREWTTEVFGPGQGVRLIEPALFDVFKADAGPALAVGALHEVTVGTASRVSFQVFSEGTRLLTCALPDFSPHVLGAAFSGHQAFMLVDRGDGGFALEAYDLKSLPLHGTDWNAAGGTQGWRRGQ
jgi:hypothetical protein